MDGDGGVGAASRLRWVDAYYMIPVLPSQRRNVDGLFPIFEAHIKMTGLPDPPSHISSKPWGTDSGFV